MLLEVLQELVDRGNTVIVIEHNLDVIKCADISSTWDPKAGTRRRIIRNGHARRDCREFKFLDWQVSEAVFRSL